MIDAATAHRDCRVMRLSTGADVLANAARVRAMRASRDIAARQAQVLAAMRAENEARERAREERERELARFRGPALVYRYPIGPTWPKRACPVPLVIEPPVALPAPSRSLSTPADVSMPVSRIIDVCGEHFGVSHGDIISARRTLNVVLPRQIAMYLAKTLTLRSLPDIGRRMGGRDHTTVLHGIRKIEARLAAGDAELAADIADIKNALGVVE